MFIYLSYLFIYLFMHLCIYLCIYLYEVEPLGFTSIFWKKLVMVVCVQYVMHSVCQAFNVNNLFHYMPGLEYRLILNETCSCAKLYRSAASLWKERSSYFQGGSQLTADTFFFWRVKGIYGRRTALLQNCILWAPMFYDYGIPCRKFWCKYG